MTRQRRSFDPSFKLEVVKMVKEQGLSVQHVSESMSIGRTATYNVLEKLRGGEALAESLYRRTRGLERWSV